MRKYNKSRKGFTLLEVVLAIAIMMLTASVFFSLILVVVKSHTNVVAANDMADFAMLNGRAIENAIINSKSVGDSGGKTIKVKGNRVCKGATPLLSMEQYEIIPSNDKWEISVSFKSDAATRTVYYTVTLKDQANKIDGVNKYTYTYSGSVYIPHGTVKDSSGSSIVVSDW